MALKSSLLWFRRNCRKTSSRFFTSRGPRTIRADFCGDTEASGSARAPWGAPRPLTPAAPKGAQPRPPAQGAPAVRPEPRSTCPPSLSSWVGCAAESRY